MLKYCFILFLFFPLFIIAQQNQSEKIFGIVTDSLHKPLENASVSIVKRSNGAGIRFGRTDKNGNFNFNISTDFNKDSFALKVNCIGYEKFVDNHFLINTKNIIQLHSSQNTLPDVVVKDNRAIVQKGDTLNYDADNFIGKSDRYLGDILKKMPGVTIEKDGTIKYQGKAINNFYLGGDDLLGSKYNIATDNIPSGEVDKVQVIEHNQHVKMLNGIVPSDQAGINITFKNKNKFHFIDNAELEGGTPGKWNGTLHNMLFNEKFKAINEIKSNNIGNDYSRETGITGLTGAPAGNGLFNKAEMININDLYKFNKYEGLKINGYYLHDVQSTQTESSTTYFLPGSDTVHYLEKYNNRLPINALNIQLDYNINNDKTYLDNVFAFSHSNLSPIANVLTNGQNVSQKTINKKTNLSNTLQGYFLFHKKHVINYSSTFQYSDNLQTLAISPGALPNNLNDSIPYLNTNQYQQSPSYSTDNHIGFSEIFGHWMIGTNTGFSYQKQTYKSYAQLIQNDGSITEPDGFSNGLHWQQSQIYFTPQIAYKGYQDQINISAPFNFTHINYHNDSVENNIDKLNHLFIKPILSWQHKVGKENQTTFSYSFGQQAATIEQVYGGQVLSGYRNYSAYQTPLLTGNTQTISGGFDFKKTLWALFANANISYLRNKNYFLDSSVVTQNATTVIAVPIDNTSNTLLFSGNASKYIYSLNTTVAIGTSFSRTGSQQMQNGELFGIHNNIMQYSGSITPTLFNWFDLKFSGSYTKSTSASNAAGYLKQYGVQWNETSSLIFYPLKNLIINIDNQFAQSSQQGVNLSSSFLLNSYIRYNFQNPKLRKLQLQLSCNNMANVRHFQTVNVSTNIISSYSYLLQPRMLLLSAHFDL